jgi:hypothetical protein
LIFAFCVRSGKHKKSIDALFDVAYIKMQRENEKEIGAKTKAVFIFNLFCFFFRKTHYTTGDVCAPFLLKLKFSLSSALSGISDFHLFACETVFCAVVFLNKCIKVFAVRFSYRPERVEEEATKKMQVEV